MKFVVMMDSFANRILMQLTENYVHHKSSNGVREESVGWINGMHLLLLHVESDSGNSYGEGCEEIVRGFKVQLNVNANLNAKKYLTVKFFKCKNFSIS